MKEWMNEYIQEEYSQRCLYFEYIYTEYVPDECIQWSPLYSREVFALSQNHSMPEEGNKLFSCQKNTKLLCKERLHLFFKFNLIYFILFKRPSGIEIPRKKN